MWTVFLSACISVSLVMSLAFCLCWRKKSPKNDLLGLDGMVIQKNPDENVNHLPSAAPCVVEGVNVSATDINESNKRNVPATNTRRSLPDIPSEQGTAVNWEPVGDNSSEHYATVGQYQNAKRHMTHNGVETRPSISQHSSISQADDTSSPYEKVKYDKIKSKEHPYAQLQPTTSRQAVLEENKLLGCEERTSLLRPDGSSTSSEPSAPPRSRRSSAHSGLGVDIPAASAVAGGIAASPELPYMTPPVTQPNFSGDSQDSSKGYTSISVREPLANIIAQTKEMNKKRDLDQHYSTVSDDSDDVYTTIPDPNNQIYTSESETYARIPAHPITVEAEVNAAPPEIDEFYEPPPQPPPPSVNPLKPAAGHSHSRQASSSSSIANIGSPKPEKRQANSPLPPPPLVPNFDQIQRNVDDLYAKVHKNKKKDEVDGEKTPEKNKKNADNTSRKSVSSSSSSEEKKPEVRHREHNYETLRTSNRNCSDPGYERIRHEEPGYASINGPESITSSDPGYEVLKQRPSAELDPNYEELNTSDSAGYSKVKYNTAGYSVVNKHNKSDDKSSSYGSNSQEYSLDEPNYESMPSESLSSDHNYAALSESDPNYESVTQTDPNYESVRDLDEPPYERLNDEDSNRESDSYEKVSGRGYENIDSSESSNGISDSRSRKSGPPYQHLNDTDSEVPGYEKINSIKKEQASSSIESTSSSGKSEKVGNPTQLLEENAIFQV